MTWARALGLYIVIVMILVFDVALFYSIGLFWLTKLGGKKEIVLVLFSMMGLGLAIFHIYKLSNRLQEQSRK